MKEKPTNKERLEHIIKAIDRIFRFTENMNYNHFATDEMAHYAVIKNFEIIGEAAYQLSKDFIEKHPYFEWRKITAFRHILVHDYYKVNLEIVWKAIENKLMDLKIGIEDILETDF